MSTKYNHYARDLDAAFRTAREDHAKALQDYNAALKAEKQAETFRETYVGQKEALLARTKADVKYAKAQLDNTQKTAWDTFREARRNLTHELQEEVRKDYAATPDAVDQAGVTLLDSGIMTVDEIRDAANGTYKDNPTMRRLCAAKLREIADKARGEGKAEERRKALSAASSCEGRDEAILKNWKNLIDITKHLSGEASRSNDPAHIQKLAAHWDETPGPEAITNF